MKAFAEPEIRHLRLSHSISVRRLMVRLLVRDAGDYVVLKSKPSAFFGTPRETILQYIGEVIEPD
jgi:hypothetical protein